MSYTPTNWKNGDIITAEKLNKIENAITPFIVNFEFDKETEETTVTSDKTAEQVYNAIISGKTVIGIDQHNNVYAVTDYGYDEDEDKYNVSFLNNNIDSNTNVYLTTDSQGNNAEGGDFYIYDSLVEIWQPVEFSVSFNAGEYSKRVQVVIQVSPEEAFNGQYLDADEVPVIYQYDSHDNLELYEVWKPAHFDFLEDGMHLTFWITRADASAAKTFTIDGEIHGYYIKAW